MENKKYKKKIKHKKTKIKKHEKSDKTMEKKT